MADGYREYQRDTGPEWTQRPNFRLWNEARGLLKDAFKDLAIIAVKARFPSYAHPSDLLAIAEERALPVGYRENQARLSARLKRAWDQWQEGTRPVGLKLALELLGYPDVEIREPKDDDTLQWFEFEVRLRPPFPWPDEYLADRYWGDPGLWDDGGIFSNAIPPAELELLRATIRLTKPTHSRCRAIVIIHDGEAWDFDAPPGDWDTDTTATWGDDVTEHNA
jgi:hypothetical protein